MLLPNYLHTEFHDLDLFKVFALTTCFHFPMHYQNFPLHYIIFINLYIFQNISAILTPFSFLSHLRSIKKASHHSSSSKMKPKSNHFSPFLARPPASNYLNFYYITCIHLALSPCIFLMVARRIIF